MSEALLYLALKPVARGRVLPGPEHTPKTQTTQTHKPNPTRGAKRMPTSLSLEGLKTCCLSLASLSLLRARARSLPPCLPEILNSRGYLALQPVAAEARGRVLPGAERHAPLQHQRWAVEG